MPTTKMSLRAAKEKRIKDAFNAFDSDGSGALSVDELHAVLTRDTGSTQQLSEADVREIIADFDTNGDGEISLEEFAPLWETFFSAPATVVPASKSNGGNGPEASAAHAAAPRSPSDKEGRLRAAFAALCVNGI